MSTLALLLALLSAVRPTSLAAIYGILHTDRPRRLLLVFDVAGLAVTLSVGLLLVLAFRDVVNPTTNEHAVANLVLAVACFAAAIAVRRRPPHEGEGGRTREATRRIQARMHNPSVTTVAAAGVLTHFPGLFYLIALNAIIAGDPSIPDGLLQVIVYNLIWFVIPLSALALAIFRPDRTAAFVQAITNWVRDHRHTVLPAVLFAVGAYLTAKGLSQLL